MTADARTELAGLLRQVRARLAEGTRDGSPDEARECDALLRDLESGQDGRLSAVALMFLPTGSLQDIAIGGGWGGEFCSIADRVDVLLSKIRPA